MYEAYGKGIYGPYYTSGAPVAGTNEVQTLTVGGTWTGTDTFRLSFEGRATAPITWSNVNATLLASIQTALNAITGTNWIVATAGTLTAGIGTILLTFSGGDVARKAVGNVVATVITSAAGTLAVAETIPGVSQTGRDYAPGSQMVDVAAGKLYVNTGTAGAPTWTVQA